MRENLPMSLREVHTWVMRKQFIQSTKSSHPGTVATVTSLGSPNID